MIDLQICHNQFICIVCKILVVARENNDNGWCQYSIPMKSWLMNESGVLMRSGTADGDLSHQGPYVR